MILTIPMIKHQFYFWIRVLLESRREKTKNRPTEKTKPHTHYIVNRRPAVNAMAKNHRSFLDCWKLYFPLCRLCGWNSNRYLQINIWQYLAGFLRSNHSKSHSLMTVPVRNISYINYVCRTAYLETTSGTTSIRR